MARGGSRASRRLSRNNRSVTKLLKGKRKREPQPEIAPAKTKPKPSANKLRGRKLRKRTLAQKHRERISAGMRRYWKSKRRVRPSKKTVLSRPRSIGQH